MVKYGKRLITEPQKFVFVKTLRLSGIELARLRRLVSLSRVFCQCLNSTRLIKLHSAFSPVKFRSLKRDISSDVRTQGQSRDLGPRLCRQDCSTFSMSYITNHPCDTAMHQDMVGSFQKGSRKRSRRRQETYE